MIVDIPKDTIIEKREHLCDAGCIQGQPIDICSGMKDKALPLPIHMPSFEFEANFPIGRYGIGAIVTDNSALKMVTSKPSTCFVADGLHN